MSEHRIGEVLLCSVHNTVSWHRIIGCAVKPGPCSEAEGGKKRRENGLEERVDQNRLHHRDMRTPQKTATTLDTSTLRSVGTKAKLTQPTHGQSLALLTIITVYLLATWKTKKKGAERRGGVKSDACLDSTRPRQIPGIPAKPVPHRVYGGFATQFRLGGEGGGVGMRI